MLRRPSRYGAASPFRLSLHFSVLSPLAGLFLAASSTGGSQRTLPCNYIFWRTRNHAEIHGEKRFGSACRGFENAASAAFGCHRHRIRMGKPAETPSRRIFWRKRVFPCEFDVDGTARSAGALVAFSKPRPAYFRVQKNT